MQYRHCSFLVLTEAITLDFCAAKGYKILTQWIVTELSIRIFSVSTKSYILPSFICTLCLRVSIWSDTPLHFLYGTTLPTYLWHQSSWNTVSLGFGHFAFTWPSLQLIKSQHLLMFSSPSFISHPCTPGSLLFIRSYSSPNSLAFTQIPGFLLLTHVREELLELLHTDTSLVLLYVS